VTLQDCVYEDLEVWSTFLYMWEKYDL
jgi:hypothetical protein